MSSSCRSAPRLRGALALALLLAAACEREDRNFRSVPPGASASPLVTQNDDVQAGPMIVDPEIRDPYSRNAWAIGEGKRLYEQMNCAHCHGARGGGSMGPSLIDPEWLYGREPENVFATVVEGRPRGMPAYRNRLGNDDVWKIVAYVRYLSLHTPQDTRPGRSDDMAGLQPDPQGSARPTNDGSIPPESAAPAWRPPPRATPPDSP